VFDLSHMSIPVKIGVLAWLPLTATLLLSWTVPAVHALPSEILIAQKSAQDYFEQGEACFNRKDYQGAIENFTQGIRLDPNNSLAYLNRGLARNFLKDYQGEI
jgi:tetratricopeptide (TPR) repeat protein